MATCTVIFTSNSDGTISATSTSNTICPPIKSTSLRAIMTWARGVVFQTLVQGSINVVGSD